MKKVGIKTNLTPSELEQVGKGLVGLAKSQRAKAFPTDNQAEQELLRKIDSTLSVALDSLQEEFTRVLLDRGKDD
jgi:hypothetical protein